MCGRLAAGQLCTSMITSKRQASTQGSLKSPSTEPEPLATDGGQRLGGRPVAPEVERSRFEVLPERERGPRSVLHVGEQLARCSQARPVRRPAAGRRRRGLRPSASSAIAHTVASSIRRSPCVISTRYEPRHPSGAQRGDLDVDGVERRDRQVVARRSLPATLTATPRPRPGTRPWRCSRPSAPRSPTPCSTCAVAAVAERFDRACRSRSHPCPGSVWRSQRKFGHDLLARRGAASRCRGSREHHGTKPVQPRST